MSSDSPIQIIFFDDKKDECTDMSKYFNSTRKELKSYCKSIKIDETSKIRMTEYITLFEKLYPSNTTYSKLEKKMIVEKKIGDNPTIGFTEENLHALETWCEKTFVHNQIVLFDWDNTLSICNGILNGVDYKHISVKIEDVALFLFGGTVRLQMIQSMFRYLHEIPHLHIFIITRNGDANNENPVRRKNFLDIIHYIDPNFNNEHLIYTPIGLLKPDALCKSESFLNIIKAGKVFPTTTLSAPIQDFPTTTLSAPIQDFPTTKLGGKYRKQKRNSNKKKKSNKKANSKRNTSRKYDRLLLL